MAVFLTEHGQSKQNSKTIASFSTRLI